MRFPFIKSAAGSLLLVLTVSAATSHALNGTVQSFQDQGSPANCLDSTCPDIGTSLFDFRVAVAEPNGTESQLCRQCMSSASFAEIYWSNQSYEYINASVAVVLSPSGGQMVTATSTTYNPSTQAFKNATYDFTATRGSSVKVGDGSVTMYDTAALWQGIAT